LGLFLTAVREQINFRRLRLFRFKRNEKRLINGRTEQVQTLRYQAPSSHKRLDCTRKEEERRRGGRNKKGILETETPFVLEALQGQELHFPSHLTKLQSD
jgi:hypothetical protein